MKRRDFLRGPVPPQAPGSLPHLSCVQNRPACVGAWPLVGP